MKRGSIKISIEKGKTPSIEICLENSGLWLAKEEIARLFNVFCQKIAMNIRSIFKNNLLSEKDALYTYRCTENGIEKQCEFYSLEMLIFPSYRIGTLEAQIFRQFPDSAMREHLRRKETEKCSKLIWQFRNHQIFLMN